jgi:PTS system nitrogen regulatory IIA component
MIRISKYLDPKNVAFVSAKTRDDVVRALVDLLYAHQKIEDKDLFRKAIIEREKVVTTGIGMGIAIPHAKLHHYNDFFIAIAILKNGVDWGSIDGNPVRLVFMIGGPDDKQTEYLKILSDITLALKDEDRRKKLLNLESPEDITQIFKGF